MDQMHHLYYFKSISIQKWVSYHSYLKFPTKILVGFNFVFSLSVVERGIVGPKQLSRRKLEKGKRKRKRKRGRWMDGWKDTFNL